MSVPGETLRKGRERQREREMEGGRQAGREREECEIETREARGVRARAALLGVLIRMDG